MGQKLKELSRAQQVLCVTHLPQIAAFADQHFLVEKQERQGKTKTSVRLLNDEERTEEVARMLSGAKLTETSLRHAEQMLKTSRKRSSKGGVLGPISRVNGKRRPQISPLRCAPVEMTIPLQGSFSSFS